MIVMEQTVWRLAVYKDEGRKNKKCAERVEVNSKFTACNTFTSRDANSNGKVIRLFVLSTQLGVRVYTSGLIKRVVLEADFKVSEENPASIFRVKLIRVKTRGSFIRRVTRNMRNQDRVQETKSTEERQPHCEKFPLALKILFPHPHPYSQSKTIHHPTSITVPHPRPNHYETEERSSIFPETQVFFLSRR